MFGLSPLFGLCDDGTMGCKFCSEAIFAIVIFSVVVGIFLHNAHFVCIVLYELM